ncbi:MAG: Rieske (2Fe-2S) protein [Blastopirellula sp.]|nr:Rieske (2Fe-2S) protein [Blastopirellula sp.]
MGNLLRRYWYPVAASCELRDNPIKAVKLLGERLVLYRDSAGKLGLLEEQCPHRGTSLAYGLIEEDGLRCPYHGWKFDSAGRCLHLPAEPADTNLKHRVRARAYHVQELGGLIFAYLGPDPAPLLPRFDLLVWDNCLRDVGQAMVPCHWLQIMENSVDPYHLEALHGRHLTAVRQQRGESVPTHYNRRHERIGFDLFPYGIIKRRVLVGNTEEDDDWKIGHPLIFPCMLRVGSGGQHRMQFRVPVDETHTWHLWYACYRPADETRKVEQTDIPLYDVPWCDEQGRHLVDFVDGQDIMACVTQGPIADRTRETLASSDRGIAMLRRLLFEQLREVEAGRDPLGTVRDESVNELIELPQEKNKYGRGAKFLAESLAMGHARYSPLHDQILELLGGAE